MQHVVVRALNGPVVLGGILFGLDVLHVLHLSPIWRQNLGQIQNFLKIL